eukprot:scaffold1689_cov305-Prasinococcus_capsulatus_cf.AAC.2
MVRSDGCGCRNLQRHESKGQANHGTTPAMDSSSVPKELPLAWLPAAGHLSAPSRQPSANQEVEQRVEGVAATRKGGARPSTRPSRSRRVVPRSPSDSRGRMSSSRGSVDGAHVGRRRCCRRLVQREMMIASHHRAAGESAAAKCAGHGPRLARVRKPGGGVYPAKRAKTRLFPLIG